jgi:hypothetical protein
VGHGNNHLILKELFCPNTGKLMKPEAKTIMLAGSGADPTPKFSANNKLPSVANP